MRILVVDADSAALDATSRVLRAAGYHVLEASTGTAALAAASQADIVVLDVNLPDVDGFDFCRRLRSNSGTARLPVLCLSAGFTDSSDFSSGFEAGADGYLAVPVEPPVLIATLRTLSIARQADTIRRRSFLATLSHELRNPLNAILGWATVLGRKADLPDSTRDGLKAIERNSRVQAQLISDLLDHDSSGKMQLPAKTVDPYLIVRSALDLIRTAAEHLGVAITPVLDERALQVQVDPSRLHQIVTNLLCNAVQFSSRGSEVELKAGRVDTHFEISVSDRGSGIEPEFLPRIFERSGDRGSTAITGHGELGLGLAVVKQLTDSLGGSIEAFSDGPGKGARFIVKIPLHREDAV